MHCQTPMGSRMSNWRQKYEHATADYGMILYRNELDFPILGFGSTLSANGLKNWANCS
jgi:hypothetical protein